jgi:hypothetical protein
MTPASAVEIDVLVEIMTAPITPEPELPRISHAQSG